MGSEDRVDPYIKKKIDFFDFFGSKKFGKKSLIPTVYNNLGKYFWKWAKNVKISYFSANRPFGRKIAYFDFFGPFPKIFT